MRIAARPAAKPASSTSGRLCSPGTGLSSFLKRGRVELSADSGGKHFCAWALGWEPFKMVQAVWKQRTGSDGKTRHPRGLQLVGPGVQAGNSCRT